jgi:hypothetical protein
MIKYLWKELEWYLPSIKIKVSTLWNFNEYKFREHYVFSCMIKCRIWTLKGNADIHRRLTRGRARFKHGWMLAVDFRQPSHMFTFYVGINLLFTLTILTLIICQVRTRAWYLEFIAYTGIKSLNEDFWIKFIKGFTSWSWTPRQVKIQDEHDSKWTED